MNHGKILREAADLIADDALDKALGYVFGSDQDDLPESDDQSGKLIGRYKLLEQIGEGGFGVVYMAQKEGAVDRRVALKIIKPGMDTRQVVARFEAERHALAMMDHQNIASVFDSGTTEGGRPYFVMELVRGVSITEHCDQNKFNVRNRLKVFVAVCQAVQHAHQKGIIHRDIKPSNVMVTLRDGVAVPKIIDFGISKATTTPLTEKTVFTSYGQLMGTPAYMSPEQVEMGERDVDTRSDIYSLGVLLYELLTGSTPIEQQRIKRASHAELQRLICEQEPPKPSTRVGQPGQDIADISVTRSSDPKRLRQSLRGDLNWIAMKALEKNRERRYETASGLAADVLRYLNDEPVSASPPSTVYRLQKFASKHRRLITATSAFGLLLLASTIISAGLAFRATQAESKATYNEGLANQRLLEQRAATLEVREQRDLSEKLGEDLTNQLAETDKAAQRARNLLYVAHMNLIQQQSHSGNDSRILELLDLHRPADGQRDLRGFEWYYLWKTCHRNPWSWSHYVAIECVDHSPDGEIVVTGCSDGTVQAWDVESGDIVSSVRGHESNVMDIAFSPDGQTIFSGSLDRTARLWTFESGRLEPKGPVLQHSAPIRCVAFSNDGTKMASGSEESGGTNEIRIWDLRTSTDRTFDRQDRTVLTLAFSHDDTRLASGGDTANVDIWDVDSASIVKTIETGLQNTQALEFSPIGDTLVLGDSRGVVALWNKHGGVQRLGQHTGAVLDLAFSLDGQVIASSSSDALIFLWDVARGDKVDVLRGHTKPVNSISFSPNGKTLVSAGTDNSVKTWDLTHGQTVVHLAEHSAAVGSVAFSPTHPHTLASASEDGSVHLWNIDSDEEMITLPRYGGPVRGVAFSPDGKTLAYSGGVFGLPANLIFWDTENRTIRRTANKHPGAVLAIAFSPDGNTVASGGNEGLVALWDVNTATLKSKLANLTQAVSALAFSPDGKLLATSSFHNNEITLWDVANPANHRDLIGHRERVAALTFSPNGGLLASGSLDQTVRIWDVATGVETLEPLRHARLVSSLAFSPDGVTLASVGRDDQLRLWDIPTGQEKLVLPCQPEMDGVAVAFSSDGRSVATVNDRSVIVYRAAADQDFFFYDAPQIPQNQLPVAGRVVTTSPLILEAGPFVHHHTDVAHVASHWQVRSDKGSYSIPVVNHVAASDLTKLSLLRGILTPGTTYYWRINYTGSNHVTTSSSTETSFTTDDFAMKVVSLDLTPHFNRDIVKNAGDSHTDSVDRSPGSHLIVEGFDGRRSDSARAHGLPRDGKVGVHTLGDYNEPNAIQLGPSNQQESPIHVSVPHHNYRFMRFLVLGSNGNSDMPVRFHYADGTRQEEIIRCDDWFHDIDENRYGRLRTGLLPVINDMDRFHSNRFRDENKAAIFEVILKVDPAKQMIALTLETDGDDVQFTDTALYPDHSRVRFHLLAATGVIVGP